MSKKLVANRELSRSTDLLLVESETMLSSLYLEDIPLEYERRLNRPLVVVALHGTLPDEEMLLLIKSFQVRCTMFFGKLLIRNTFF